MLCLSVRAVFQSSLIVSVIEGKSYFFKIFFTEKCQQIKVERLMGLEKYYFAIPNKIIDNSKDC